MNVHPRFDSRRPLGLMLISLIAGLFIACGTDFVEPAPVSARSDTPVPQATVFRVIPATPLPTATALPTAVGPDGSVQRPFPDGLDPGRLDSGLPTDEVFSFWDEYLGDSRLIVENTSIDVHLCADGRLIPGSASSSVSEGAWGLRPSSGEWYEVILGREFRPGRISGIVRLSRVGSTTVALGETPNPNRNVVSVTDSELCTQSRGD